MESIPLTQKTVFLKIDCDFKDRADKPASSTASTVSSGPQSDSRCKMVYTLPHFMGYRFGLFNFATKTAGGFVDFDYFASAIRSPTPNRALSLVMVDPLKARLETSPVSLASDGNRADLPRAGPGGHEDWISGAGWPGTQSRQLLGFQK